MFLDKPKIAFFALKIHKGEYILCSFTLFVPKLYFYSNLKWHCLHLKGILDPLKPLIASFQSFLSFLNVCPKVAFLDKPQIAFSAFKIHTGECILHLFGLYVPKLYFHFNLKWHCLHLKSISDPLKPLCLISNFLLLCPKVVFLDKPKVAFFAFKIRTGEYIHCPFGLYVSKMALFTFERYFGSSEAF